VEEFREDYKQGKPMKNRREREEDNKKTSVFNA